MRRPLHHSIAGVAPIAGPLRPLVALAMIGVSWVALGSSASAGVATPSSVLQATRTAIGAQPGVQVSFTARSGSTKKTETIVADVGRTSGQETISVGTARLAVRVTPTHGYVSGNAAGLTTLFGLSAAQASTAGRRWVAWKVGTSQYANLKADLTMTSVTELLPKPKGTTLSSADADGVALYVLSWTLAATSSTPQLSNRLTISAGNALPLGVTATASDGTKATTTLSGWGTTAPVSPPPAASTIASSVVTG